MKKFTKILALSLALIMSVMMLASCALFAPKPAKDPEKAEKALKDNKYDVMLVDDEKQLEVSEVEILVQILGKPKARIMMPADASPDQMQKIALENPDVKAAIGEKQFVKAICVPKRLVNIVVR